MLAGKYDITIEQGATFRLIFVYTDDDGVPFDLTGYTARMQGRTSFDDASTVFSLSSADGDISIDPMAGEITITMPAADTAAMPRNAGVWDLELVTAGGDVVRLVQGNFTVSPEVTR